MNRVAMTIPIDPHPRPADAVAEPLQVKAAGGVVCDYRDSEWWTVLVSPRSGEWRLPKGMLEHAETETQGAIREVAEETGLSVRLVASVGSTVWTYSYQGSLTTKTTYFFLMIPTGESRCTLMSDEILEATWVSLQSAHSRLTFPAEQDIARSTCRMLQGKTLGDIIDDDIGRSG